MDELEQLAFSINEMRLGLDASVHELNEHREHLEELVLERTKELERANNRLQESENRFRALTEAAHEGVVMSYEGKIIEVNKAMGMLFGYRQSELQGMNAVELAAPKYRDEVRAKISSGYEQPYEVLCQRKDGTLFAAEIHGKMIRYDNRQIRVTTVRDMSARKELERERNQALERLTVILDSIDALVYVADMDSYELLFLNQFGADIFGPFSGKKCWQLLHQNQTGPCPFCANHLLVKDDGNFAGPHIWEMKNSRDGRWYSMRDTGLLWVDGRRVKLQIATDITEKKTTEEERETLIRELEQALDEIRTLQGILPICSSCKKIRNDQGYYEQIESYMHKHVGMDFSHTICPDCLKKLYPEEYESIMAARNDT